MKRNRIGRAALATMMSLALGLGVTACSRDYTVAYVYATSAQNGTVSSFAVDYQTGSLVQIAGSPFASGLTNPVTLVVHPSNKVVYVIGGSQDNKVVEMAIGTDGKLYGQHTYGIGVVGAPSAGNSVPTAAAVDPSGSFLYVTFTYQTGYNSISTGPGGMVVPITTTSPSDASVFGTLGTPTTVLLGNNPVAITTSGLQACTTVNATDGKCPLLPAPCNLLTTEATNPGLCHYVYAVDADTNASGTGTGQILSFLQTAPAVLQPLVGTTITTPPGGKTVATGTSAGTTPTGIAEEPTSRFLYVTDRASNQLYGYAIQGPNVTSYGAPVSMSASPFLTGQFPVAVTIDPRGKYMYTANFGASTVTAYAIDPASGTPSSLGGANNNIGTGPTCVAIEPALGKYLYTSNRLAGTISAAQLDPHSGALSAIENQPFDAGAQLSCVAAAANGEHALALVNP